MVLALAALTAVLPNHASYAGSADDGSSGAGGASAVGAPPGPISVVSPAAASVSVGPAGGECLELTCDKWLREEHKKILLGLLSTYRGLSNGKASGSPANVDIVATLTANLVAKK